MKEDKSQTTTKEEKERKGSRSLLEVRKNKHGWKKKEKRHKKGDEGGKKWG